MSAIIIDYSHIIVPFGFCLKLFNFLGNFGYDMPIENAGRLLINDGECRMTTEEFRYMIEKTIDTYGTPEWREMLDLLMEEWEIDYDEGDYLRACNNLKEYNDFAKQLVQYHDSFDNIIIKKSNRLQHIKVEFSNNN